MKDWGVWLGAFVLAYEVRAKTRGSHTWTDHCEDGDLITALPALVFTGWIVQHLIRAIVSGPSYTHKH